MGMHLNSPRAMEDDICVAFLDAKRVSGLDDVPDDKLAKFWFLFFD